MQLDRPDANMVQQMLRWRNGQRALHYQHLFMDDDGTLSIDGEKVLADLCRFCRGNQTTFHDDPRKHALLEGRREVFLRLLAFLDVDSRDAGKLVEVFDE